MRYSSLIALLLLALGGIASAQLLSTGAGKVANGGGGGGCTGTIDLSTGCVQPMLGGL